MASAVGTSKAAFKMPESTDIMALIVMSCGKAGSGFPSHFSRTTIMANRQRALTYQLISSNHQPFNRVTKGIFVATPPSNFENLSRRFSSLLLRCGVASTVPRCENASDDGSGAGPANRAKVSSKDLGVGFA